MLDAFNANLVVLYNHGDDAGGFFGMDRKDSLPIGKVRAYAQGGDLLIDVEFDPEGDFAWKVEIEVTCDILSTVSVRILTYRYHEDECGGFDCKEQELLEGAVATIAGNQRAVRVKELANERTAFIQDVANAVVPTLGARERNKCVFRRWRAPMSAQAEQPVIRGDTP